MQDIAGCRIVVEDSVAQDRVVEQLVARFPINTLFDRRQQPSHGYRAVHVVVTEAGSQVEIQVRTQLQHLWAELSEKLSDLLDPSIKYGGGDCELRTLLFRASACIAMGDQIEKGLDDLEKAVTQTETPLSARLQLLQTEFGREKSELATVFESAIELMRRRGQG